MKIMDLCVAMFVRHSGGYLVISALQSISKRHGERVRVEE